MGASAPSIKAAEQPAAESLLTAFKSLSGAERRRHASVLNYWLSVRGDKEFPPLHDLDPLELSDAGPSSILMELISGGHDAEIRHLGEALREEAWPDRIIDAPNPSVLSCIAKKLPIVAISRDFLAFEDEYESADGKKRCSVTLLPLSAGGAWVDYVYALVSVEDAAAKSKNSEGAKKAKAANHEREEELEPRVREGAEELEVTQEEECSSEDLAEPEEVQDTQEADVVSESPQEIAKNDLEDSVISEPADAEDDHEDVAETTPPAPAKAGPGFSKLLDSLAGLTGFYGSNPVKVEAVVESASGDAVEASRDDMEHEPASSDSQGSAPEAPTPVEPLEHEPREVVADEPEFTGELAAEPVHPTPIVLEGSLQNKLTQVRAKADEARMARLRANAALYEGLGAAYDFALDAEDAPEEYLRLVEAQGLKIQLRSPMKPVVKLAFAGMCDDPTIKQLEAVLAWAFEEELPRGTLAERIEAAGGIGSILSQESKAA